MAIWLVATALAAAITWLVGIGRVIYEFDATHGVHEGDVLAFLVAWMWAARLSTRSRRRR